VGTFFETQCRTTYVTNKGTINTTRCLKKQHWCSTL